MTKKVTFISQKNGKKRTAIVPDNIYSVVSVLLQDKSGKGIPKLKLFSNRIAVKKYTRKNRFKIYAIDYIGSVKPANEEDKATLKLVD